MLAWFDFDYLHATLKTANAKSGSHLQVVETNRYVGANAREHWQADLRWWAEQVRAGARWLSLA